jgi:hypothetical protein
VSHCIVCEIFNCDAPHTYAEIDVFAFKSCPICRQHNCTTRHSIEELKNPVAPSYEEARNSIRICIAFAKLTERMEVEFRKTNGDDQASTG